MIQSKPAVQLTLVKLVVLSLTKTELAVDMTEKLRKNRDNLDLAHWASCSIKITIAYP